MERAAAMSRARMGQLPAAMEQHYPCEAALARTLLSLAPQARPTAGQLLGILQVGMPCGAGGI
ncbi:protein kinase domain-containing protein, partial [Haematococcus lacustris]